MISLDYKLTSAQVKVLLYEWHGYHWRDGERPVRDLFYSKFITAIRRALCEKGLLEVVAPSGFASLSGYEPVRVTAAGAAIAEHIVLQAQKILSLNESRREFLASLPAFAEADARDAAYVPEPIVITVRRRPSPEAPINDA